MDGENLVVNPRLTDALGIPLAQEDVEFAIPFIDEDLPFSVDPFLLWKSPSFQEHALHVAMVSGLNYLGRANKGNANAAIDALIRISECEEVGLGASRQRIGKRIGESTAQEIMELFAVIPEMKAGGLHHIEELQFVIDGIGPDRVSDFACSLMKSALIDFSMMMAEKYELPTRLLAVRDVFDLKSQTFADSLQAITFSPVGDKPILLVPKRWLRKLHFIGVDDYRATIGDQTVTKLERSQLLTYNRENFGVVRQYVKARERSAADCINDPLFKQLPALSIKNRFHRIQNTVTGKDDMADRRYEDLASTLITTLLYPDLDFAATQVRTESGAQIRDLLFYNTCRRPMLKQWYEQYSAKQVVFELKNVNKIERDHMNQMNRYLAEHIGHVGIILTRNPPPASIRKHAVDIWSGQRKCILFLSDGDLELMVSLYESKQREPFEVIERAFVNFMRECPV